MHRTTLILVAAVFAAATPANAGQPLETESARIGAPGAVKLEAGMERQRGRDGTEAHVPLALEYVPLSRLELMVEPVVYSRIRDPRTVTRGVGDVEATAIFLAHPESGGVPALAVAAEIKVPTARQRLIGSGKADYAAYLIASKRIAGVDLHANLGYTIIGAPAGVATQNVSSFALALERPVKRIDLVGEVVGTTAALAEGAMTTGPGGESLIAPEIGSEELVGTIGARYRMSEAFVFSLGMSYDQNHAFQVHPGLTVRFR